MKRIDLPCIKKINREGLSEKKDIPKKQEMD